MSRFDTIRYHVEGTLTTTSPLAIGAMQEELVDIPIQTDGSGRPVIPGTALTGAMRACLGATGPGTAWGDQDKASSIVVDDATWMAPTGGTTRPLLDVREGVSLNRYTRTAEDGFLYDYEVVPSGTRFDFRMTVDDPAEEVVGELLAVLQSGFPVGRSTSKGLGGVLLESPTVRKRRRGNREDLVQFVTGTLTEVPVPDLITTRSTPRLTITLPWQARSPVLVIDKPVGNAVDFVPKVARFVGPEQDPRVRLLLPGSSIKGALRAHAERILRTVLGIQSGNRPDDQGAWPEGRRARHKSDLQPSDGMELVALLFGSQGDRDGRGRRGAVTVAECLSRADWSEAAWTSVIGANKDDKLANGFPQGELLARLCTLDGPCRKPASTKCDHLGVGRFVIGEHVAIDRWTGGVSDGALYSVLEPWFTEPGDWDPLGLDIAETLLGQDETAKAALYLLMLTLRDFSEGWIPLGFGSAKGYGHVEADLHDAALDGFGDDAKLAGILDGNVPGYREAWLNWIERPGKGEPHVG